MKGGRLLCKSQNTLGEGICYDATSRMYYWVDIPEKYFMSMDSGGKVLRHELPIMAGFIALAQGGGLIIGGNDKLLLWNDGIVQECSIGCDADKVRINDGCVHPSGEFIFFGTCHLAEVAPEGSAYCLRQGIEFYRKGWTVFNGPAFSPKGDRVYFADSPKQVIYRADIDLSDFSIGSPEIFAEVSQGYPDGMAIDSQGCLWNAHWDGGMITRYDPDGKIMDEFAVPVQRPTALAFTGDDLKTIVVTSASTDIRQPVEEDKIQDGDLFAFDVDVAGMLVPAYRGNFFET